MRTELTRAPHRVSISSSLSSPASFKIANGDVDVDFGQTRSFGCGITPGRLLGTKDGGSNTILEDVYGNEVGLEETLRSQQSISFRVVQYRLEVLVIVLRLLNDGATVDNDVACGRQREHV